MRRGRILSYGRRHIQTETLPYFPGRRESRTDQTTLRFCGIWRQVGLRYKTRIANVDKSANSFALKGAVNFVRIALLTHGRGGVKL